MALDGPHRNREKAGAVLISTCAILTLLYAAIGDLTFVMWTSHSQYEDKGLVANPLGEKIQVGPPPNVATAWGDPSLPAAVVTSTSTASLGGVAVTPSTVSSSSSSSSTAAGLPTLPAEAFDAAAICKKIGWRKRADATPKPRIFYAMVVNGAADVLETHLEEIYPYVEAISVNEAEFLFDGTLKTQEGMIDFDSPALRPYADKLRY